MDGGHIGILDRLGLKGEDWSEFSAWFGSQLIRLVSAYRDSPTPESDALLVELDRRVRRFVDRRGEGELVRAMEAWVHGTADLVAQVTTVEFHDAKRFEQHLARLERQHGECGGLRQLEHALHCMGVLPERLQPPRHQQDPRTALPAMVEVVWPTTAADDHLREELSGLIGAEAWRGTWELCALRAWTFSYLIAIHFKGDDTGGARLTERLNEQIGARAEGQLCPPNVAEFLAHRAREYFKIVQKGGPKSGLLTTPIVAGAFAWYCRRTLDLQVRLIGAREFSISYVRLDAMMEAYRKSRLEQ